MSSELERLLREGRGVLPEPDAAATEAARRRAIGALRPRRRRRLRALALAVVALGVAAVLGTTIATALTPSGEASKGPVGLGFVPEPGWYALQAPTRMPVDRPAVAMAANVPFAQSDVVDGMADSSALPYATLLALPQRGIVIVAASTESTPEPSIFPHYPRRSLPLSLREAAPYIEPGTQLRPEEPLGQYELRARIEGYDVDIQVYFGVRRPGPALLARADRQLEGLVVRTGVPAAASRTAVPAARVIDRSFVCSAGSGNGARWVAANARTAFRKGGRLEWLGQAVLSTPGNPLPSQKNEYQPTLVGLTAGWPPPEPLTSGALGWSARLCTASPARVPFTRRGLMGGAAGQFGDEVRCITDRRVAVRVRATFAAPVSLTFDRKAGWYTASGRIARGQLVVRSLSGRTLVYGDVLDSGAARLYYAARCS